MNKRKLALLLILNLTLSSCAPLLTNPPQTATITSYTAMPYPKSSTQEWSIQTSYPGLEKQGLTPTPVNAPFWMDQPTLYLQPGDLPVDVQIGRLQWQDLRDMAPKFEPPQAAIDVSLLWQGHSENYSYLDVYFYPESETAHHVYRFLVDTESFSHEPLPQPDIGQEAALFKPQAAGIGVDVFFWQCHSVVMVRLDPPLAEAEALQYAGRLAERLAAVDCQSASEIPVLTPPAPLITTTPAATAPIQAVITPTMHLLPDPDGTNIIRAYTFSDSLHGWLALGPKIFATTDGGQSWTLKTQADSRVEAITFLDQKIGWLEMVDGYLLTEDGGQTWKKVNSQPVQLPARMATPQTTDFYGYDSYDFCKEKYAPFAGPFFALDEKTGWAYCTSRVDTHFMASFLYRTEDSGAHWQLLGPAPHGPYGYPDLFFLDAQHGWIGTTGGLYASQDGGLTWSDTNAVPYSEANAVQVLFLSPKTGFVILIDPGNRGGTLLRTDDGGTTWNKIYVAPPPAAWPFGPVVFFSDGSGLGEASRVLITRDEGRTWTNAGAISFNICTRLNPNWPGVFSFIDQQNGWYANGCVHDSQSIIFHTIDGGSTWASVSPSRPINDALVGISFVDANTGYAVTQSGLLLKSVDGGLNFETVDDLRIHTPNIYFVNANQGWENRGGSLFATQDGGKTWSQLYLSFLIQGFTFLPNGYGWVIAGETASAENPNPARLLMKTTDNGRTWSEFRLGNLPANWRDPMLDTIQFTDENHGWLRADQYLFFTNDGGQSWTQLH